MLDAETALEAMRVRHSVRQYADKPIPAELRAQLQAAVDEGNEQGKLHMQLFFDEPSCFDVARARYGKFSGVRNYLAIVGVKAPDLEERAGFWGERVVILAQSLGLNSCWVGLTHGKSKAEVAPGEKQVIVVALGYGETQGVPHKSKPASELVSAPDVAPQWFERGAEAALLAPTAINQQKFHITYDGERLTAEVRGRGFFTACDLGIVKSDFELASGHSFDM